MRMVLVVLAAVGALAVAAPSAAAEWSTSYGTMTLPDDPEPGQVRVPYGRDEGRIMGTLLRPKCLDCGLLLEGIWVEAGSGQDCATAEDGSIHWGDVALEFDPAFTAFEGTWDYCGDGRAHTWSGTAGTSRRDSEAER